MYLGGHRRWVPLFIWKDIGRTRNDLSQNVTLYVRHGLRYLFGANLGLKT